MDTSYKNGYELNIPVSGLLRDNLMTEIKQGATLFSRV